MAKKKGRLDFVQMKQKGEKVAWVTAYDFPMASFAEQAGMDMILVGDSLGMVLLGYPGTVPVTMEECLICCKAVHRGAPNTFCIGDMPFLSYQTTDADAVMNAGRFLKEADMDAVKLEGGRRVRQDKGHSRHRDLGRGTRPHPPELRGARGLQSAGQRP